MTISAHKAFMSLPKRQRISETLRDMALGSDASYAQTLLQRAQAVEDGIDVNDIASIGGPDGSMDAYEHEKMLKAYSELEA